jgi:AcrR family transcriptional regulator
MAQRPKEAMRRAILDAAAEELAELGFERATLAGIAARGGTSIGNLYKYFENKDQLFHAAIPPDIARELGALIQHRVESLGIERDARRLGPTHPYERAAGELFQFVLAHRAKILFLLGRAEATPYATFAEELAQRLTKLAVAYVAQTYPKAKMTAARRRALVRVYRAYVTTMAAILREEPTEHALREATAQLSTYHLAGLRAFFEAAEGASEDGSR